MLGYVTHSRRGDGDRLLTQLARHLQGDGIRLAGAIQLNHEGPDGCCDTMDLMPLGLAVPPVRISQVLGNAAKGCRLNPAGLEEVVGLVDAHIARPGAQLVILNKFGRQEAEGGGFRPVIARAIEAGLPVVTHVSRDAAPAFREFTGDLAEHLPSELDALVSWCQAQMAGVV